MTIKDWDQLIANLPGCTFLQTEEWSRIKEPVGWQPDWHIWPATAEQEQAAAMMLVRTPNRLSVSIAYVPRGPLVDWGNPQQYKLVLNDLIQAAREKNAIFLKIDPDLPIGRGIPGTPSEFSDTNGLEVQKYLKNHGWVFSQDQIQFRNTVEIDLSPTEESMLARMHPKTRYNIRLAERKGVFVSEADPSDWQAVYHLYAETAARDGFIIRPWEYYKRVWNILTENRMANCLKAEIDGALVGAIWVVAFGKKAHYLYGMSSSQHRDYMPNHILQWRGMLLAKSQGRAIYDMWGAPNDFTQDDSLSGVFRFKQGFGGEVIRTLGAWDYPIKKRSYQLYTTVLPKVLKVLRQRNREKNRQLLAN
jgi:peptidoglycan pentaglycine glycine transferase (the first glycine)